MYQSTNYLQSPSSVLRHIKVLRTKLIQDQQQLETIKNSLDKCPVGSKSKHPYQLKKSCCDLMADSAVSSDETLRNQSQSASLTVKHRLPRPPKPTNILDDVSSELSQQGVKIRNHTIANDQDALPQDRTNKWGPFKTGNYVNELRKNNATLINQLKVCHQQQIETIKNDHQQQIEQIISKYQSKMAEQVEIIAMLDQQLKEQCNKDSKIEEQERRISELQAQNVRLMEQLAYQQQHSIVEQSRVDQSLKIIRDRSHSSRLKFSKASPLGKSCSDFSRNGKENMPYYSNQPHLPRKQPPVAIQPSQQDETARAMNENNNRRTQRPPIESQISDISIEEEDFESLKIRTIKILKLNMGQNHKCGIFGAR